MARHERQQLSAATTMQAAARGRHSRAVAVQLRDERHAATAIEAALRNIVVQELGLQAEKAAVTTAEQAVSSVTASTGKIKDQMNVLIRGIQVV